MAEKVSAAAAGRVPGNAKPSVLVLGAGGFIGCHLTKRLLEDDRTRVTAVDLYSEKLDRMAGAAKVRQRCSDALRQNCARRFVAYLSTSRTPYVRTPDEYRGAGVVLGPFVVINRQTLFGWTSRPRRRSWRRL